MKTMPRVSGRVAGDVFATGCSLAGAAVMIAAIRRVTAVAATEKDILFGVMLASCLGLLLTVLGLLGRMTLREGPPVGSR